MNDTIYDFSFADICCSRWVHYADSDLVLLDHLRQLPFHATLRIHSSIIIFCYSGECSFKLNGSPRQLQCNDVLLFNRSNVVSDICMDAAFEGEVFVVSEGAVRTLLQAGSGIWKKMMLLYNGPQIHLQGQEGVLFRHYFKMLRLQLATPADFYQKEIMQNLLRGLFYKMANVYQQQAVEQDDESSSSRGEYLFRRFMELLSQPNNNHRDVAYYAGLLCVTSKYLSLVCVNVSGKSAGKWIQQSTLARICHLLRHTEHSIKEISVMMDFPSVSVFGRYVHNALGMSPSAYRMAK